MAVAWGPLGAGPRPQLRNKVRRCPCGKPNGYTLKTCNACGSALPEGPRLLVDLPLLLGYSTFNHFVLNSSADDSGPLSNSI